MSTNKPRTLSIENLNSLYFDFIGKFVTPNLYKSIAQVNELLQVFEGLVGGGLAELLGGEVQKGPDTPNHHGSLKNHTFTNLNSNATTVFTPFQFDNPKSAHS